MRLPRAESPLTGGGSLTSVSYWTEGITWFLAVTAMMAGAKWLSGQITSRVPATKAYLTNMPFGTPTVQVGRRNGMGEAETFGI